MSTSFPWRLLLACLAIGLLLRLGLVLATPPGFASFTPGDRQYYHRLAVGLAAGRGLVDSYTSREPAPTAFTVPGAPVYMAVLYRVCGPHPQVVRVANALLDTVTVVLIFLFAWRLSGRARLAAVASALYALSPLHLLKVADWDTMVPATFMVALTLYVDRVVPARGRGLVVGLLVGLGCLVRPALLLVMPAVLLIGRKGVDRAYLWDLGWAMLGGAVAISPWVVRNYLVFHHFIPFGYQSSWVFYRGWFMDGLTTPQANAAALNVHKTLGGVAMQSVYLQEGVRVILADPAHALALAVQKVFRFWLHLCMAYPPEPKHLAVAAWYATLYLAPAFVGIRSGLPQGYRRACWVVVLLATGLHMATYASVVYSLPYYPALMPAVAAGWLALGHRVLRR